MRAREEFVIFVGACLLQVTLSITHSVADEAGFVQKEGSLNGEIPKGLSTLTQISGGREKRLLGGLRFGSSTYSNNELDVVKQRITQLLDKISDFEKVRAKASSINRLQKLIKAMSNVCPPNTSSLRVGNKCYEHVTNLWMDYDSAMIYCSGRGGTLAHPDLEDANYLLDLREYFPNLGDNSVLVGINDINQEGHFTYTDGTPVSPSKFYEGKFPIFADKDCVSLTTFNGFGLVDTDCKRLHEVLCQYQPANLLTNLVLN